MVFSRVLVHSLSCNRKGIPRAFESRPTSRTPDPNEDFRRWLRSQETWCVFPESRYAEWQAPLGPSSTIPSKAGNKSKDGSGRGRRALALAIYWFIILVLRTVPATSGPEFGRECVLVALRACVTWVLAHMDFSLGFDLFLFLFWIGKERCGMMFSRGFFLSFFFFSVMGKEGVMRCGVMLPTFFLSFFLRHSTSVSNVTAIL